MKKSGGVVELAPGALLSEGQPITTDQFSSQPPVPPTAQPDTKKRSRPKKLVEEPIPAPPPQATKRLLFGQEVAVLTESEAVGLRAKLVESILDTSIEADRIISNTNRMGKQAQIWSTISRRDAEVLTDAILILGRRSAMVGLAVRGVVKTWTLYHAGIIVGPRLVETVGFYIAAGGPSLWPLILQFQNSMGSNGQTVDSSPAR